MILFQTIMLFSREVSIYDPIGADKDGETVSLFDVLESGDREVLETVIIGQDVKILYEAYRPFHSPYPNASRMRATAFFSILDT